MVDYNSFAKTFSDSRKNMKWPEMDYFLGNILDGESISILDIWCGNWRFLWELKSRFSDKITSENYLWVDLSKWLLDEAKKQYPEYNFQELNMLDLDEIKNKFSHIFFFASYHHLQTLEERWKVIKKTYALLEEWWKIYMTNWALNSDFNRKRYDKSVIVWTENQFWSIDYNIKIWEFERYYHCFDISELEYLFKESWFEVIENRLFDNQRNIISIIKKTEV